MLSLTLYLEWHRYARKVVLNDPKRFALDALHAPYLISMVKRTKWYQIGRAHLYRMEDRTLPTKFGCFAPSQEILVPVVRVKELIDVGSGEEDRA
jgi:hypothetical protein